MDYLAEEGPGQVLVFVAEVDTALHKLVLVFSFKLVYIFGLGDFDVEEPAILGDGRLPFVLTLALGVVIHGHHLHFVWFAELVGG